MKPKLKTVRKDKSDIRERKKNVADSQAKDKQKGIKKEKKKIDNYGAKVQSDEFAEPRKWYQEFQEEKSAAENELDSNTLSQLQMEACRILNNAVTLNSAKTPKSMEHSEYTWIKTVLSKGTMSDKIAANTLLLQSDPLHHLSLLKNMISMVRVGKKRECFMVLETLLELFLSDLLPPNRKLTPFAKQPLSKLAELPAGSKPRDRRLMVWYFEDQLKQAYRDFIVLLNQAAHDSVDANKEKAISAMHKLLAGHPEQESALLTNIVNKLGDPSHKIGSKVIYTLTKLLEDHPNMKEVVMEEVEKVIFRSNISRRAQYYSVCFLGQFILSRADIKIAKNLIAIYFSLFKACVKTGDIDSRLMSALLTGVNRAYPFAKSDVGNLVEHVDTMYKVVHMSSAHVATHALYLLFLVSDHGNSITDRFFTVLYKKMADPTMFTSSQHAVFLSLIFKAMKKDPEENRVCVMVKRLLQMCLALPVPVVCGLLMLISEVVREKKALRVARGPDASARFHDPDGDGDEHYEDVALEPAGGSQEAAAEAAEADTSQPAEGKPPVTPRGAYDPYHRSPLQPGGATCIYTELTPLTKHFHPTVALFATNLMKGLRVAYPGDPLQDFSLIRFLDKFVFKNPKTINEAEATNSTFSKFGRKKYYTSSGLKRLRANTKEYLNSDERAVPVDEKYLYRYIKTKEEGKRPSREEEESDVESVASDEFEAMMDELGGKGQDEEDIDFLKEAGQLPKKKKGKDQEVEEDDLEDEEEEGEEIEDDDLDGLEDETFEGDEMDDVSSDEDMEGSELDPAEHPELAAQLEQFGMPRQKQKGRQSGAKHKLLPMSQSGVFAAAEEFSELLEEPSFNSGTSTAFSNRDNAGIKQLKWESKRNEWIENKGQKRRNKGFKHQQGAKKRKFK